MTDCSVLFGFLFLSLCVCIIIDFQFAVTMRFFFFLNKFIYFFFLSALGLHCCTPAFSSCGKQASHCGGFSCCRARALGPQASVVVAHGFSSCGSRALE